MHVYEHQNCVSIAVLVFEHQCNEVVSYLVGIHNALRLTGLKIKFPSVVLLP